MRSIPSFKLVAEPLDAEAAQVPPFKWAGAEVGKRHRLGGRPESLEPEAFPVCSCRKPMTFYGQLDSINDEFVLADTQAVGRTCRRVGEGVSAGSV
jgi:hypothetical protein